MDYSNKFSRRAREAKAESISAILKTTLGRSDIISFAVGTPATALLPTELLEGLTHSAIAKYGKAVLQYGLPKGFPPLIEAVQPLLAKRGITAMAETIHISTGGSGALNNACMTLLDNGDIVLVESPTYSPAVRDFQAYGANVVPIACDEFGMLPEALESQLKKQPAKIVYVLPTFQNPTGNVMPLERRQRIAELARQYDSLIIEDDVYYDLRYRGQNIPALQTFAPERVLYLSSVSKTFAPAMRVGFAVVPEPILAKLLMFKHNIDMTTSPYTQALTAEFLTSGAADTHIKLLQKTYAAKLDAMLLALKTHMPANFSWNQPEGGLFLWVQGPKGFNADNLIEDAIAAGIAFIPGSGFYVNPHDGLHTMRLCFAHPSTEEIETGITILARLCKEATNA